MIRDRYHNRGRKVVFAKIEIGELRFRVLYRLRQIIYHAFHFSALQNAPVNVPFPLARAWLTTRQGPRTTRQNSCGKGMC